MATVIKDLYSILISFERQMVKPMRRIFPVIAVLAVLLFLFSFSAVYADQVRALKIIASDDAETNRRIALVIGNADYKSSPLRNPVNDAEDMAAALRQLGFKVFLGKNMSRKEMRYAVREFGKDLRRGGVGLFFYAGHGMQVKGVNYLIPTGADIKAEYEIQDEAVDAGMVLRVMEDAGNMMNIVFLDACRNNPYARSFRSGSKGLAQMDAPSGSLIVYSTAPGSVAADGKGRNGIFTKNLLAHLSTDGLEIGQMLRKVRVDVRKETSKTQTPWESSSLEGNFYFNPGKPAGPLAKDKIKLAAEKRKLEKEKQLLRQEREKIKMARLETRRSLPKSSQNGRKGMARILGGEFVAGLNPNEGLAECNRTGKGCKRKWFLAESPEHKVLLDTFFIDKFEVTQSDYMRVMGNNPSKYKASNRPVETVNWYDARTFCEKEGKRLPTEAEWEKAAKGGKNLLYPWGNIFDGGKSNFCDRNCKFDWKRRQYNDKYSTTAPVGSYPPNGYGLYDMAGNVLEWVSDWHDKDYYQTVPRNNPLGPEEGTKKVMRGGSWFVDPYYMRAAYRNNYHPDRKSGYVGFRCAVSAAR